MSKLFIFIPLALCAFIPVLTVARVNFDSLNFRPELSAAWNKGLTENNNSHIALHVVRIDHKGVPFPRHLQFRHTGQAIWHGKTFYRLQNSDKNWIIELLPFYQLHRLLLESSTTSSVQSVMEAGCYYKGYVLGEMSSVKVSLCGGMTGDIHTSSGNYVIYPYVTETDITSHSHHYLSFMQNLDADRPWRPLVVAPDFQFCDVRDDSFHDEEQERLINLKHSHNYLNSSTLNRKRRSESRELHLEVLVVADSKMASYHGSGLKHYILTLMSTVALIYKDHSIGNNINIAVVDIAVLNKTEDYEVIHHIAPITLRKFCRWQHLRNKPDDRDPAHYDTAVLITREDLCRYPGACDTLGLAQSGMVCDSSSSCAIVEDNGLSAAFTIAHELGHVMSIPHDDDNKCAKYHNEKKYLHVMARMLDYNSNPWSWSDCSREYLTTFFDVGFGSCMMDKPGRNLLLLDDEFQQSPGQLYPKDRQCELVFGPQSRICPYMPECKRLWCTMEDETQGGCRTQHMPWADGTQCGESKVSNTWPRQCITNNLPVADGTSCGDSKRCFHGDCVQYIPAGITPIDGQWGKWKPFSKCSRTCGGGLQHAFRECNSPKPANGGRYCTGTRIRYKSCNTQDCPEGSIEFRAAQCAEFNGIDPNLPGVPISNDWVPQYNTQNSHEKCKLYCKNQGSPTYYTLKQKVTDGTTCELGGYDICVNGYCEHAGCDHVLHSKKTLDRCGICGGSNTTCKEISGIFNTRVDYGYHDIILVPTGASNILVTQTSLTGQIDDNYIALKDPEGTYLLNGEFMITMFPKKIQYDTITMDYSGSNSVTEFLNSSQALTQDLFLQVLVVGKLQPPNISFSYTVPLSQTKLYTWKLATHFSECSRMCNGVSTLRYICIRRSDQHAVNDNHCAQLSKPSSSKVRKCNEHCQLSWKDVSKSECSVQCGSGVRQRIIKCMKDDISIRNSHVVPEEHCQHLGPKPSLQEQCWGLCRNSSWVYSEWSQCSVSCGTGVQQRYAECRNSRNNKEPDEHCNPSTKVTSQTCAERACPYWGTDDWTQCSASCGGGTRMRLFFCMQDGKYVDERYCSQPKPEEIEECGNEKCYQWTTGEWQPCSVTCGSGYTERIVVCQTSKIEVDPKYCEHLLKPPSMRNCSSGVRCPHPNIQPRRDHDLHPSARVYSDTNAISEYRRAVWKSGEWSQCSVTCGEGYRSRIITCHNLDDDSRLRLNLCDGKTQPVSVEKCEEDPCPKWQAGMWSECSVTCGRGYRYRTVHCIYSDRQMQTEDSCNHERKPEVEEMCVMNNCPPEKKYSWLDGPWSECSTTCGEGIQMRTVHCLSHHEGHPVNPDYCPPPIPPATRACTLVVCPTWQWSEWTQCPTSCGQHEQWRYPHCVRRDRIVPDDECASAKPPPEQRRCKIPVECSFRWRKGTWSQCHASCGLTYKVREVACIDHMRNRVAEEFCLSKPPPKNSKQCNLKPCPYTWKESDWSECSTSCDEGYRRRNVTCHAVNAYGWVHPETVDEYYCDSSRRPSDTDRCNYGFCKSGFIWRAEAWGRCEGHCENAIQKRRILCFSLRGHRASNTRCDKTLKPSRKKKCLSPQHCPPQSCRDLQNFQYQRTDGEYNIQIRGKTVSIYCHNMHTAYPQEYVTLREENNAIIYSSTLSNKLRTSDVCLKNNVIHTCDCNRKDTGFTVFKKIALNVTTLKVIIDDFTFANAYYERFVPYGTAGDCFRNPACLHGQFDINLKGTDFRVASETNWVSRSGRGQLTVKRHEDDQVVRGMCGGYCDTCSPDPYFGFGLDLRMPA